MANMCVCNCSTLDMDVEVPVIQERLARLRPGLFYWISILLLSAWVLIVAVAANTVDAEVLGAEAPTIQTFIEELI